MDELLTEQEKNEAQARREALLNELRSRGDLPKSSAPDDIEKSNKSWQKY